MLDAPLVGLTGRLAAGRDLGMPAGFADAPADVYFSEYAVSVADAGGLAVHLPMSADPVLLAARLDALILAGGADVDPERYGARLSEEIGPIEPVRDEFELTLLREMLASGKPVLGICRGAQLLNVAFGGTLIADLSSDQGVAHDDVSHHRAVRRHEVTLVPGSVAARIYGESIEVNSFHHQAVDQPGDGVQVVGWASDGVVEAIEVPGRPILGVQWHPEALDSDPAFAWLVAEARADL